LQRFRTSLKAQARLATTLEYSRPIYVTGMRYRSARGVACLFLAALAVALTVFLLCKHCPWPFVPIAVGLVFLYGFLTTLIGVVLDWQMAFKIEANGILMNRPLLPWTEKFIPWSQVVRFGAFKRFSKSVLLFYTTAPFPKGLHYLSALSIPVDAYEKLVQDLRKEIGGHYPHLEIGGYEIEPHSGGGG
jgi:hypothetical protein